MNPARPTIVCLCAGLLLLGFAARTFGEDTSPEEKIGGPLIPVLSNAMDAPEFVVDCSNETGIVQDIAKLMSESSIVLDGVRYRRHTVKFAGNPNLRPGSTYSMRIGLASYLPSEGRQRQGYSKKLKRWRWKAPLESGRHTLTVEVGGETYGPITFDWNGDLPLLYE